MLSPRTPRQLESQERVKQVGRLEYLKQARQAPFSNDAQVVGFNATSRTYGGSLFAMAELASPKRMTLSEEDPARYHRKSHNRDVYRASGVFPPS